MDLLNPVYLVSFSVRVIFVQDWWLVFLRRIRGVYGCAFDFYLILKSLCAAERYGKSLNSVELQEFEALQDDYEVNWHLKDLRSSMNPSAEDQRSRAAIVQNRRLAYMNRLVQDGQYFSEDSMRMRSPLIHYEHVGQFQVRQFQTIFKSDSIWKIRLGHEKFRLRVGANSHKCHTKTLTCY